MKDERVRADPQYPLAVAIVAVVIGAIAVAGVTWNAGAAAKDPMEQPKLVLTALTTYGALVAFFVGLMQYRTAQKWKRAEFVASESTKILQDPRAEMGLADDRLGGAQVKAQGPRRQAGATRARS